MSWSRMNSPRIQWLGVLILIGLIAGMCSAPEDARSSEAETRTAAR